MKKTLTAIAAIGIALLLAAPAVNAAEKGTTGDVKKTAVTKGKTVAKAPAAKQTKVAKASKAAPKKGNKKSGKGGKTARAPLPKSDWSPNNFPAGNRGWCTWYVDGRYYKYFGEKIELSPRPGSNAHLWYPRAQNVTKDGYGEAGDVMVLKRPKGDRTGHVAFVEEVIPGVGWVVSQANFDFPGHKPMRVDWIDGRKITTDLFLPGPRQGTVRLAGGNSVYNLIGFLHKEENNLLALAGGANFDRGGIGADGFLPDEAQLDIAAASLAEFEEKVALEEARLSEASYAENVDVRVLQEEECGCSIRPRLTL